MHILNGIRQQEQPSLDLPKHVHQGQIEPIKILQCLILITAFRILEMNQIKKEKNLVCKIKKAK